MRINVTISKMTILPPGAIDALTNELSRRIHHQFPEQTCHATVRYAAANHLSVIGGTKENNDRIRDILQET